MDPYVHGFVSGALKDHISEHRSINPHLPNGSDPKAFEGSATLSQKKHNKKHHKKHHKHDVAERGMDEEVHGFVKEAIPPLNTRVRSEAPFVPNGSDESAFEGAAFNAKKHHKKHHKRHHKRDVAERGMDEEVHGFVKEAIPPLNTRVRSEAPFVPNGSDDSAFEGAAFTAKKHQKKHGKRDIAERGMDEEVYDFTNELINPLNVKVRSTDPFVPNGSDSSAFDGAAFMGSKNRAADDFDGDENALDTDAKALAAQIQDDNTKSYLYAQPASTRRAFVGSASLA